VDSSSDIFWFIVRFPTTDALASVFAKRAGVALRITFVVADVAEMGVVVVTSSFFDKLFAHFAAPSFDVQQHNSSK
jgi:hypothetical protein